MRKSRKWWRDERWSLITSFLDGGPVFFGGAPRGERGGPRGLSRCEDAVPCMWRGSGVLRFGLPAAGGMPRDGVQPWTGSGIAAESESFWTAVAKGYQAGGLPLSWSDVG